MKYIISNPLTGSVEFFDADLEAQEKLNEIKAGVLERESYRFSVAKEVVEGNNTTWMHADLDNDYEDGAYQVFNTLTGQYETVNSLAAAKERLEEVKTLFIDSCSLVITEMTDDEYTKYLDRISSLTA